MSPNKIYADKDKINIPRVENQFQNEYTAE